MPRVHAPGSPLRMRGKVVHPLFFIFLLRITPAYAGKSHNSRCNCCFTQDHPCVCGEKFRNQLMFQIFSGSPLRMRGKERHSNSNARPTRITPAYAGKREKEEEVTTDERDHPCVCGEKAQTMTGGLYPIGSPLRMRGKEF